MRRSAALLLIGCVAACHNAAAPAPPAVHLEMTPSRGGFAVGLFQSVHLGGRIVDVSGNPVGPSPAVTVASRDPSLISVDSGTWISARRPTPGTYVTVSATYNGAALADSALVTVTCPLAIVLTTSPRTMLLPVGESATARVIGIGCGGLDTISNVAPGAWWSSLDATIAFVDSASGLATGRRPGTTTLNSHTAGLTIPVTVR